MGANGFSYNLRLRGRALPQKLKNFHQDLFFTDGQSLTHARTPTNQTVHFSKQKSERKKCSILWISIKLNFSSLIAPERKIDDIVASTHYLKVSKGVINLSVKFTPAGHENNPIDLSLIKERLLHIYLEKY